jgi:lipopolysaccharide export system protein LptA
MKKIVVGLLSLVSMMCVQVAVHAERADALQKLKVMAESADVDMVTEDGVAEGRVTLTRGTLVVNAGKMKIDHDNEGYAAVILTAAPGTLVTFRQKRDGRDLWVDGEAERIVYTERDDVMKLTGRAKVTNLDGSRVVNQASGQSITYDSRKQFTTVLNAPVGQPKGNGQLIELVFDRKKTGPANSAPAPAPAAAPAATATPATPASGKP